MSNMDGSKGSIESVKGANGESIPTRAEGWTEEEEARLFELHNTHGNRWAKISHFLPGK
jgi:hypothetical protein